MAQSEWKKTAIYIFSIFGSKSNELEQEKSEKKTANIQTTKKLQATSNLHCNFFQEKLSHQL